VTALPRLETFSYLPELTPDEVGAQIQHVVDNGLVVAIEHTDHPDAYDHYWTLWRLPLFQVDSAEQVVRAIDECRCANPGSYVKVNGYDPVRQGQVVSFVVQRPEPDP